MGKVTGPLASAKATTIMCAVLDAMQYAHDKNILHRDIKPNNIMISKDGKVVKIMDFGIAKLTDGNNFHQTQANAQIGTPFYMSPEQVTGMPYTRQSDIYSLGVTLFEMVTGKCPYHDITNAHLLNTKITLEPLPPTSKYYPSVSQKLQNAINIATEKSVEKRFKTCNEFKQYLLSEETKPIAKPQQPTNKPAPNIKLQPKVPNVVVEPVVAKIKTNFVPYIIAGILALGVGGYFVLKAPPPPPQDYTIQNLATKNAVIKTIDLTN